MVRRPFADPSIPTANRLRPWGKPRQPASRVLTGNSGLTRPSPHLHRIPPTTKRDIKLQKVIYTRGGGLLDLLCFERQLAIAIRQR
jgi:hypothetical protein